MILEDLVPEQELDERPARLPVVERTSRLVVALKQLRGHEVRQLVPSIRSLHHLEAKPGDLARVVRGSEVG